MLVDAPKPEDSFGSVANECGPAAEFMAKLPPKIGNVATKTAVVGGALASLALVPGSLLVSGVAALVGGGLTRLTVAPLLVEGRYKALQYKVASLLDETGEDWTSATKEQVQEIVESWGLSPEYNVALLSQIYARYLIELLKLPEVKLAELNQMLRLKDILNLDDEACGDAHYQAAVEVYRDVQWVDTATLEDPESYEYQRISKLFFMCRSVLVNSGTSTDEATEYEMGRVRSAFSMASADMLNRCDEVSQPFYQEAVDSVLNNLEAVGPEVLIKLREKLAFSSEKAALINRDIYSKEVESLLEQGGEALTQADRDRLAAISSVLSLDPDESERASSTQTKPRFARIVRSTLVDDMEAGALSAEAVAESLSKARGDMMLDVSDSETMIRDCVRERFAGHVIDCVASASIETRQETADYVRKMASFKQNVDVVLDTLGSLEYPGDAEAAQNFKQTVLADVMRELSSAAAEEQRAELFQIALRNNVEDDEVGAEAIDLPFLKNLLGLQDGTLIDRTYRAVVEPKLDEIIDPMLQGEDFFDKGKVEAYLAGTTFPDRLYKDYAVRKYESQLNLFRAESAVITSARRDELDRLQDFLSLEPEDVRLVIKAYAYPVYKKSVEEAIGSSGGGVIIEEYKEGLAQLRERLQITEEDAAEAMRDAAAAAMTPMFEAVQLVFEESIMTKEQLAQKRGVDDGEDLFKGKDGGELGITAAPSLDGMLGEISNLYDFYKGNELDSQGDVVKASTFLASKAFNEPVKANLYKQALVRLLSTAEERDAQIQERFSVAVKAFPDMLGLTPERSEAIRNDIGKEIATNYCKQALSTKASLDANDIAFVENVAKDLDTDLSEVPIMAKKLTLIDRITKVSKDDGREIANIRDAAIAMGVDFSVDLKLTQAQLSNMFTMELAALVEDEIASAGNAEAEDDMSGFADSFAEIAEAYGLEQEEANAKVTKMTANVALGYLESAQANAISERRPEATQNLDKLVACAKIIGPNELKEAMGAATEIDAKVNKSLIDVYTRTRKGQSLDILTLLLSQE